VNTVEAARHLETTIAYLCNMRHFGTGPRFSQAKSGRVFYLRADLDEWDAARQAKRAPRRSEQ